MIYFNLADQGFKSSSRASVGVYNVSVQLGDRLSKVLPCTILLNPEADLGGLAVDAKRLVVKGRANGLRRVAWDQWGLFSSVDANPTDWLFLPKGFSSFTREPPCRLAVYIHDVVYSYWRRACKGYRSPLLHRYFDLGLKASLRKSDVVFVNSEFTAGELKRFAEMNRLKKCAPIVKAGIGFDHLLSAPCDDERSGILVYVSSWPHKASGSLVEMMERWQNERKFSETVYFLGAYAQPSEIRTFSNWTIMETLPEDDYRALLGRVRCTVFNSEYEGFGMPPGESVIQGAVPVFSSIPTLNEVMGTIGFSYENLNYTSFALALDGALSVSGNQLTEWRSEFLNRHNWNIVINNIENALG